MALTVPDVKGEILMLQYIVGMVSPGNPVLHLFSNEPSPPISDSTILANLTECTSAGYAAITLTSALWTTTQLAGVTTAVYSEVTFNFGTNAVAMGYYVTTVSGDLLWLERFSGAPFDIPNGGGTIGITSKLTLS
jgi:hypothetical protein